MLLFDGGKEILATFGDKLSEIGRKELEATGVEMHTESIVTHLDASHVEVKGPNGSVERYAAQDQDLGGRCARPHRCAQDAGRRDRAPSATAAAGSRCSPTVRCPGYPEVFAVGDMMNFDDLPGVAEVAMQSGIHAARTIKRRVANNAEPQPFTYRDLGSMAAISRRRAIVSFRGGTSPGGFGWLMWMFVHLDLHDRIPRTVRGRVVVVLQLRRPPARPASADGHPDRRGPGPTRVTAATRPRRRGSPHRVAPTQDRE